VSVVAVSTSAGNNVNDGEDDMEGLSSSEHANPNKNL